jgi:hypothetical protein
MTQTIKAALPEKVVVDAFPDLHDGFNLPAVFFGMTGFVPGPDNGTGLSCIRGKFQAVILVDPNLPYASLAAMWLGMRLVTLLRAQYWDLDFVDAVQDVLGEPDNTNPALAAFEVWGVSWTQDFYVGNLAEWPFPEIVPVPVDPLPGPAEVETEVEVVLP